MPPAIILVNTQMPENIGATARAMLNFGLTELVLVKPREDFPNQTAYNLAGHAEKILDNAKIFENTRDAVAQFERVYAATARMREMVKPVYTPLTASIQIESENLKSAIMFGPERSGLINDDVTIADAIITIPTSTELPSLNIAQSVVAIAYQYFQIANKTAEIALNNKSNLAKKEEITNFLDFLERKLDESDFWKVPEKKQKMLNNLQNIFTRASLTEQEVRTLHGVIAELHKNRR